MNSTKSHKTATSENDRWALSPSQLVALDALSSGSSITEAAQTAGVRREAVSIWVNHHAGFIAEANRRRQEVWANQLDRLRALTSKALDVFERKLDAGNLRAAEAVLKKTGTISAITNALKTNPVEIEQSQQLKNLFDAVATLPKDGPLD